MAAIVAAPRHDLHLNLTPTQGDLHKAGDIYNSLPEHDAQPTVPQEHLKALFNIIEKHGAIDTLKIHLAHGHLRLPQDHVMFGSSMKTHDGIWTRPTNIRNLPDALHSHILLARNGGFFPYEFRDGKLPGPDKLDPALVRELHEYLMTEQLSELLGLQLCAPKDWDDVVEFVLDNDNGTCLINEAQAQYGEKYCTTGWNVKMGIVPTQINGGESHAATTRGTHQVFTGSKPLPTVEDVEKLLVEEGLILPHPKV